MRKFTILLAIVFLSGAVAAAAERSPFVKYMKARRLKVPTVVGYKDFVKEAMNYAMTEDDVRGLFAELEIPIVGEEGSRYMRGADLLRGCGADCHLEDGLGYLLAPFLYPADLDR